MSTVEITPVAGSAALHHRYPRETQRQPCHVELDCRTGALGAEYDTEIGDAVPADVHHGHRIRWAIPALRADAANELLAEIAPLAQRIVDGYESARDGHNHVARLDDDAKTAREEIESLCDSAGHDDGEQVAVWAASDWFSPLGSRKAQAAELGITAATTDDEIDTIATREEAAARGDECDEIEGCAEHLRDLRNYLADLAEAAS